MVHVNIDPDVNAQINHYIKKYEEREQIRPTKADVVKKAVALLLKEENL